MQKEQIKNISFPICYVTCDTVSSMGVSECENICFWKFDKISKGHKYLISCYLKHKRIIYSASNKVQALRIRNGLEKITKCKSSVLKIR